MNTRALIMGVDSNIGKALAYSLRKVGWEVIGTSRRQENHPEVYFLDFETLQGLDEIPSCDFLFLCAAMTRLSACREDPMRARRINVEAPLTIVERFCKADVQPIFLSSSAVFDGTVPSQMFPASHLPVSEYGKQKYEAEQALMSIAPKLAILRLTKVLIPTQSLLVDWIKDLQRGEKIRAFNDMFMAPITLDDAVTSLMAIATKRYEGLFQMSAAKDISYYEAATYLAEKLGLDKALVTQLSAENEGIHYSERPSHTTLETGRAETLLGKKPPSPYQSIDWLLEHSMES
jgi:dTDP-4-dehydrorhamnose reductase